MEKENVNKLYDLIIMIINYFKLLYKKEYYTVTKKLKKILKFYKFSMKMVYNIEVM